ncbi:phosphotransacetylase family protein [Spirulina sp. CS-785/01]|uniref:phosphotransacetylase family protein n=1 Tax=Spirulina sp. CS-785/01 TaxID=3021716 RepID=UPI00232C4B86|nr:phosphotransacetylase family protein [Spirulina sp. CS-785/01]MDB9313283.1 phosphotransacetylase family protein [Spirulina sp. CS-785/01]
MPNTKYLLVGSTETYSGKSATILGVTHCLRKLGIGVGYGKPLGRYFNLSLVDGIEEDLRFIGEAIGLPQDRRKTPLLSLHEATVTQQLRDGERNDYRQSLQGYIEDIKGDLVFLEGPSTLWEGRLFDLSIGQMAEQIEAGILLVARYHALELVDQLLDAQERLGDRLMGVLVNDIPDSDQTLLEQQIAPFLERQGIPILGQIPSNGLLRSVSVRELSKKLGAKVLCRRDRLDLLVENLTIGAMNVNTALEYFRKGRNMAVVTGGDRSELQMAALETATNCLILTGHTAPQDFILSRAEDLEIPILSVDLDTLTTVEIADQAFGQVRLQEPIKVECIRDLMGKHFDINRFISILGLERVAVDS